VAHSCNPATGRPDETDGLRSGYLARGWLRGTGVRTEIGIDMGLEEESPGSRLSKEQWNESGGETQQLKAAVSVSSGIAPVSGNP